MTAQSQFVTSCHETVTLRGVVIYAVRLSRTCSTVSSFATFCAYLQFHPAQIFSTDTAIQKYPLIYRVCSKHKNGTFAKPQAVPVSHPAGLPPRVDEQAVTASGDPMLHDIQVCWLILIFVCTCSPYHSGVQTLRPHKILESQRLGCTN